MIKRFQGQTRCKMSEGCKGKVAVTTKLLENAVLSLMPTAWRGEFHAALHTSCCFPCT